MAEAADGPGRVEEGTLLWSPGPARVAAARMTAFARWLESDSGLRFPDYPSLWRWSVEDPAAFWGTLWRYFDLGPKVAHRDVLRRAEGVEGARWFVGQHLNYAAVVARQPASRLAVIAEDESSSQLRMTYGELLDLSGAVAAGLRRLGVSPGDRVAAVLPNGIHAVAAFLGAASIGAVWSACAPEFGAHAMVDRFRQIEPKVLLMTEGYRYGGRDFSLGEKLGALVEALPDLSAVVSVGGDADTGGAPHATLTWSDLVARPAPLQPIGVDFDHPLWILYSSGTTGPPKAIVHSHGGIVVEHLKALALHCDLGEDDVFFWFSTTGWMMWNFLVGGLLIGTTIVCFDGHPMWPDAGRLWEMAERLGVTFFGTSAPFLEALRRDGYVPGDHHRLGAITTVGSTGAPLSPEGFAFAASDIASDVLVASVSGGTDVCTAFLGSCPTLPVRAGEIQCRMLGASVEAFDADGVAVVGQTAELVVTEPMPSMPIAFWGDPDGSRMHESYFSAFPGVWRHGDWVKITPGGACVVYGRSDATLNRGGVRSGAADFYRVVDAVPGVADSLVVDTSELGTDGRLLLFVAPDETAGPGLADTLRRAIREEISPRHVPDEVVLVARIPKTLNGKRIEVPARRILLGTAPDDALTAGAVDDRGALEVFVGVLLGLRSGGRLSP